MHTLSSQRGAMFGLDARIALAIFGGLAIIVGMSIASIVQEIKVTQIITQADNTSKAITQYILDTGLRPTAATMTDLNADSGATGWNGPYLPFEGSGSLTTTGLLYYCDSATGNEAMDIPTCSCTATACNAWLLLFVSTTIAEAIDLKVDGVAGSDSGKVRTDPASRVAIELLPVKQSVRQ